MAYLGNNLQVAFSTYKNIDNISASFNGVTTTFPLLVNGISPVPSPINAQQCLISVGGVPQKPDPTGVDGFNLVGGNIVFSSAPASGLKFWGVILAGADYVTAGTAYPNGSVTNPSITFSSNTVTGLYLSSLNVLGFTVNGASVATLSSSGLSLGSSTTLSSSGLSLGSSTTLSSSNLKLNGATSGQTTLIAPAVAGNNTLTLPTGNGSANQLLKNSGTAGSLTYSSATEDSSGVFAFNSGYGSTAPVYGCRAWVNFNGTATGTFAGGASTVTRTAGSTTATVTTTNAHNLITGNRVYAASGVAANLYAVTVLSSTTFTITTTATTVLNAVAITFNFRSIRASGNVNSVVYNGAGDYILNFSSVMPDTNYATSVTVSDSGANFPLYAPLASSNIKTTTAVEVFSSIYDTVAPTFVNTTECNVLIFR